MNFALSNLSVRNKLLAGFGIVLALMIIMSLVAVRQLSSTAQQVSGVIEGSVQPLILAESLQSANKDIGIAVRDIVSLESVAAQKEAVKGLKVVQREFVETLGESQKRSGLSSDETALLQKIEQQYKATLPMIDEVLAMVDEANFDSAKVFVFTKLRPKQAELSATIAEYLKIQLGEGTKLAETAHASATSATRVLLGFVVVALAIGGVLAWLVTRAIVGPLQTAARFAGEVAQGDFTQRAKVTGKDELATLLQAFNHMSDSLGATIRQIRVEADRTAEYAQKLAQDAQNASERSQEQVSQVMAVTSAVEQMSVSIREVSTNADGVNAAAQEAHTMSVDGSERMTHNLGEVQMIVSQVESSGAIITELSSAITQINAITNVIKEIADQTNLLALNAAIEAARAGEQGRGFAVVADEVRKLAERTRHSTTEIGTMLQKVEAKAAETVGAMTQVKQTVEDGSRDSTAVDATLRQIVAAVTKVSTLVADIAAAAQEQSRTTESTARSIEAISGAAEETSLTIQRVGETASEMNHVSQDLQQLVSKFRINA